jgi:hypothetical protein
MRFARLITAGSCALLAGCAHDLFSVAAPIPTPPGPRCDFVRYRLDAEPPHALMKPALVPAQTVADVVEQRVEGPASAPPKMLFMSGGSQHGAFGAGLLDEWRILAGGTLPRFKVVTGISTGSILATFAFTGDTEVAVGQDGYGILRESQLLTPYLDKSNLLRTLPIVVKHGAVADLTPLRRQLMKVIDAHILGKVAAGAAEGRLLMVGAVDVDSGTGVAFDMTEMATRIGREGDAARREQLRGCYVDAILASSSAPMAAPPVFIDNIMYVDGGARFGVFSDDVNRLVRKWAHEAAARRAMAAAGPPAADPPAIVYMIVNGTLRLEPECGYVDCPKDGKVPTLRAGALAPPHGSWSLPKLGLRSVDILENQVYALSVDRIEKEAVIAGRGLYFTRMGPGEPDHQFEMPAALGLGTGTRSCSDWSDVDDKVDHPLQFHPRYMHCLIDYGRSYMRKGLRWDRS